MIAKAVLLKRLKELISDFKDKKGIEQSEDDIQTLFTVPLLNLLDWNKKYMFINKARDSQTKKRPDILLQYKNTGTDLFIIESKDASNKDMLDGSYPNLTFTQQLFNYCEGAGLYWGILTNFIEWRVYNTFLKDLYEHKKYAFHDLLWENANKNNYIDLLSDEGLSFLMNLSFDSLVNNSGKFDPNPMFYPNQKDFNEEKIKEDFFIGIKKWRNSIIKCINRKNDLDNVDIIAQQILDRIIFIEICHDKGIIGQDILSEVIQSNQGKYGVLINKFRKMDDLFNSELFLKSQADNIDIDDEVITDILKDISKLDFKNISINIIGDIYERFLGEIKRGSTAEKEKSKKHDQGVYYTPEYVVRYIVRHTVGEKLKNVKTEQELRQFRVLDPACGSGSFLISVFDEFLTAYRRILPTPHKDLTLFDFEIKKTILLYNIYGVDIDDKAVEITKLNLLIKSLEGLKSEDLQNSNHLLPNLRLNIRNGNSLISGDMAHIDDDCTAKIKNIIKLKKQSKSETNHDKLTETYNEIIKEEYFINNRVNVFIDDKTMKIKKPFNYHVSFCDVFDDGGFDCVIGNPPYLKEGRVSKTVFEGLKSNQYYQGKMDIWYLFGCISIDLLKKGGFHSFIATNNWATSYGASIFRNKVTQETKMIKYFDFNDYKIFKPKASIQTMIYILEKNKPTEPYKFDCFKVLDNNITENEVMEYLNGKTSNLKIASFKSKINNTKLIDEMLSFSDNTTEHLLNKIKNKSNFALLENETSNGFHDHHGDVNKKRQIVLGNKFKVGDGIFVLSSKEKAKLSLNKDEAKLIKPCYTTDDIDRYYANKKNTKWLIYTTSEFKERKHILPYPNIKKHLDKFHSVITSDNRPYGLHRAKEEKIFIGDKVIVARKCVRPSFSYVDFDSYVSATFYIIKTDRINNKYLTALFNSKLIQFWLKHKGKLQGNIFQLDKEPLMDIPILKLPANKIEIENKIASFVDDIIIKKRKSKTDTTEIKNLEEEIDLQIFRIYDLSSDEIALIRSETK